MSPELTVVIPTHGKRPLLARTLGALETQDLDPGRWDLVVVDDASPDDTGAWLRAESVRWGERLKVVTPERNVGRARARNLGAQAATGSWLLFLDDDIVAPPALLRSHLAALGQKSNSGTIGLVITEPALVDAPHFHYIDTRGVAKVSGDSVPARYLVTQNTAVPREAFLAVGGFDEAFLAYGFEDMDLGFRLGDHGVDFRPLRSPVPHHVHHHTLEQWLAKKRECGHGPLQHIAAVHPGRLKEMRLHWVVDPPRQRAAWSVLLLRRLACWSAPVLGGMARLWPTGETARPRTATIYTRLMDLLVLSSYCQGVAEYGRRGDGTA